MNARHEREALIVAAVYLIHYDTSFEPVSSPDDVADLLDDDADMINPQGTQGMSYFLGVQDSDDDNHPMREPVLRIDLDPEIGSAAVRWLPDGTVGVEEGYTPQAFRVCESSASDLASIPASIGLVSYEAARRTAEQYIATGERPSNVTWQAAVKR